MDSENVEDKSQLKKMSMADARIKFRIRSKITNDVKMNQQNDKANARKLWKCSECGNIDSQSPFFADLRERKSLDDDEDLINYFGEVMKIR